jgi:hypothetical protein
MADAASATTPSAGSPPVSSPPVSSPPVSSPPEDKPLVFRGTSRNLVPGAAFLFAGVMAFAMGMTDVFFAEAIAWTFAIWGVLLIYSGLFDVYNSYAVTDTALVNRNPMRPWRATKVWDWEHINRLDVVVKRPDGRPQDAVTQVYFTPPGELALEREDREFDPFLTELVIERAGLRPGDKSNPKDLHNLPRNRKATFTWNK